MEFPEYEDVEEDLTVIGVTGALMNAASRCFYKAKEAKTVDRMLAWHKAYIILEERIFIEMDWDLEELYA